MCYCATENTDFNTQRQSVFKPKMAHLLVPSEMVTTDHHGDENVNECSSIGKHKRTDHGIVEHVKCGDGKLNSNEEKTKRRALVSITNIQDRMTVRAEKGFTVQKKTSKSPGHKYLSSSPVHVSFILIYSVNNILKKCLIV